MKENDSSKFEKNHSSKLNNKWIFMIIVLILIVISSLILFFVKFSLEKNPNDNCDKISCENCAYGHLEYYLGKCVECINHLDCQEGFDCLDGVCTSVECISSSDCEDNKICLDNSCISEEEIYNEFQTCNLSSKPQNCSQNCENCIRGKYSCIIGAWKDTENGSTGVDFCAECLNDELCKRGYKCEKFKCVLE